MHRLYVAMCVVCVLLLSTSAIRADVIFDWNNVALNTIRQSNTSPPVASRALAMMHSAMFDAVNSVDLTCQAYHSNQSAAPGSSAEAAAAQAARDVLASIYPTQTSVFNAALANSLASVSDGASKTNGVVLGHAVANDIVQWRANDGSSNVVPYTPSTDPGKWRPTPPAFQPALLPGWGKVTTFAMTQGSQFRGSGPPPLSSAAYAADFNETKSLGALNSVTRTADQTQIALFWSDGGGTATPPGHWNEIAQVVATQKGNTLAQNARLFALLNISMADAAICAWDDKYAYNAWRPITAIQLADPSVNPDTLPDINWKPLLATPPFPEYMSGHSTFSGAAAETLAQFYGTDNIAFTIGSDGMPGSLRGFDSFSQAADEAGRSRIYGGIHFEFSDQSAIACGRQISDFAFQNNLQPIPEASTFVLAMLSGIVGLLGRTRIFRSRSR